MKRLLLLGFIFVTGCSAGDRAAKKYENAAKAGASFSAKCDRANAAIKAYLDEGDKSGVDKWSEQARSDCALANLQNANR